MHITEAVTPSTKLAGSKLLMRSHQLQLLSSTHTKSSILEQQKNVWRQEYFKLNAAENKLCSQVCTDLVTLAFEYDTEDLRSCLELSKQMDKELYQFQENVVAPLSLYGTDIKKDASGTHLQDDQIHKVISNAREKCSFTTKLLENEQIEIEKSLQNANWDSGGNRELPTGIPEDFLNLSFADLTMKQALLDELWALDDKYQLRLLELDDKFQKHNSPGWNEVNNALFSHIINMFQSELTNRKILYMDFLKQIFPQRTMAELEAHRAWREKSRFYHDQRSKSLDDWNRERWVWLMLSKSICVDEHQKHESLYQRRETMIRQKDLCFQLRKKVEQWRNDKAMEDQMLEELQSHWLVVLQRVQEERTKAESVRRQVDKQKLVDFYESKLEKKKETEKIKEQQLQKMKKISRKSLALGRERVLYRVQQSVEQQLCRQKRLEEQKEENALQQIRLQELKTAVYNEIKTDPKRTQQPTVSFLSKKDDCLPEIQQPFQIHTYTDEQISRDLRIQAEQKLRETGLLRTNYAFQVLKEISPPTQPRRDTFSAISLADM